MYWDVGTHISAKARTEGRGKAVTASFSTYVSRKLPGLAGGSEIASAKTVPLWALPEG
jgi:hypothetical protein